MNRNVIYTSVTYNYDGLHQHIAISSDYDYICFTNDYESGTKVGIWEIRPIPFKNQSSTRLSRYVKLLPHEVFQSYDWSVWLDTNLIIKDKLFYDAVQACIDHNQLWSGLQHPKFDCIYDDAKEALRVGRAHFFEIKEQVEFLLENHYPRHFGLYENNIIVRKHNDPIVKSIDEQWWNIYNTYSKRDQLSLFYLFKKNNFMPSLLFPKELNSRNSPLIECVSHPSNYLTLGVLRFFLKLRNRIILRFSNLFNF